MTTTQPPTENALVPLVSLEDLILESARPIDWLIEGIYATGETVLVSGASHSGKTYLLLDQGLAVAYGRLWLGRFATKQTPVIYVPSEGRTGIGRRVTSTIEHYHPYDDITRFFLFPEELDLTRGPTIARLELATAQRDAGLIIIDVLRDATPGVEENSAAMGDAFGRLRDLAHNTGATVLVAHHLGKDTTKGSRGHSSIKDKSDQEVLVKGTVISDGIGGIHYTTVTIENSKNRNQDNWGRLDLDLRKVSESGSPVIIGERSTTAIEGLKPTTSTQLYMLDEIDRLVGPTTDLQHPESCRTADLVEATGKPQQQVAKALKALVSEGYVEVDKTSKAHRFSLTPKGRRATTTHLQHPKVVDGQSTYNTPAPYVLGSVVGSRRTVVEELLEVQRQENYDPGDIGEPEDLGGDSAAELSAILGERSA